MTTTIQEIINKYKNRIDLFDLELLIANSLEKPREFVLANPEYKLNRLQILNLKLKIRRRLKGEPIAYILGHKEFYGLDFIVNKHTLIPRPETELLVELTLEEMKVSSAREITIVDVGTGSGNIITSIAKTAASSKSHNLKFIGIDISKGALKIARKNAKLNDVDKKIDFLYGSLLSPILKAKKLMPEKLIILANLPYLSKEIYQSAPIDVKKFEPKTALYSPQQGLQHYRKLLKQICSSIINEQTSITMLLEISPEQKQLLPEVIKPIFPSAKISFQKDLAGKWRVCKIII